jgi:hypothetical protein
MEDMGCYLMKTGMEEEAGNQITTFFLSLGLLICSKAASFLVSFLNCL